MAGTAVYFTGNAFMRLGRIHWPLPALEQLGPGSAAGAAAAGNRRYGAAPHGI